MLNNTLESDYGIKKFIFVSIYLDILLLLKFIVGKFKINRNY